MGRQRIALGILCFFGTLANASSVRADFISWSATYWASPALVKSDQNPRVALDFGTGTPLHASHAGDAGDTFQITTIGFLGPGQSVTFSGKPYFLNYKVTDKQSGDSANFSFSGEFFGTLTSTKAHFSTTFSSPLTLHQTLGGNYYTLSLLDPRTGKINFIAPGPLQGPSCTTGSIGVSVTVQAALPEPSTLALAGTGVIVLGLWRRWRKKRLA